MVNKLVSGAYYSARAAAEQRHREAVRKYNLGIIVDHDISDLNHDWNRTAERFSLDRSKTAILFQQTTYSEIK